MIDLIHAGLTILLLTGVYAILYAIASFVFFIIDAIYPCRNPIFVVKIGTSAGYVGIFGLLITILLLVIGSVWQ